MDGNVCGSSLCWMTWETDRSGWKQTLWSDPNIYQVKVISCRINIYANDTVLESDSPNGNYRVHY